MTAPYDPEPTEIYEPATGKWTAAAPMPTGAIAPAAAGLPDGRLQFAGGSGGAAPLSETQIYTPSTLPGAPRAVGAVPGDGAATVTWTPPARDGDNPIRGYTVTAPSGQQVSAPDERTSIAVSGLTNGQPVTFTVTARTAFGTGAASAPSAAVTPTAPPPASRSPGQRMPPRRR
jgi:hypothetical protein